MSGFFAIFKRELLALFVTPLAWIVIALFLAVEGLHFYVLVVQYGLQEQVTSAGGPMQTFFGGTILFYLPVILACPVLTMRLFAEERRSGTIEALLTAPVGSAGIVLAKYCAALTVYVAMWAPTSLYMVFISQTGEVDLRVLLASYLAVFLVGAGYLAIGLMASAFTKSQVIAVMISASTVILLFTIGLCEFVLPEGPLRGFCSYVSVWSQMAEFSQGSIDLRRLVLDGTLIALPLFITVRAVDAWRWG